MTGSAGTTARSRWLLRALPKIAKIEGSPQGMIADILDAVDEAVIETDALVAKLRTVHIGIVNDLLAHGLKERRIAQRSV